MNNRVISGPLVVDAEQCPDAFVLTLYGELDLACAPVLEGEIEDAETSGEQRIVIDLSGLEFIDSTGLSVLLDANKRAVENGHRLSLIRGPRPVHRIFELTQTTRVFLFED